MSTISNTDSHYDDTDQEQEQYRDDEEEEVYYDEDLVVDEVEYQDNVIMDDQSVRAASLKEKMRSFAPIADEITDTKSMVKYHLNWYGLPLSLFAIYHYGRLLFSQMSATLPTVLNDEFPIQLALKTRYVGALIYFLACLLYKQFVFEQRNSEGPILVSTVLELYYMLNCKDDPPTILELLTPMAVASACFLRRKPYIRIFTNPWSKDKSELLKLIRDAKETAGLSYGSDL